MSFTIPCEANAWHDDANEAHYRRLEWVESRVDALWADADDLQGALALEMECPPDVEVCDAMVRAAARGDELATKLSWWLDPILRAAVERIEERRAEP